MGGNVEEQALDGEQLILRDELGGGGIMIQALSTTFRVDHVRQVDALGRSEFVT